MTTLTRVPEKRVQWEILSFFIISTLLGLIGMPLYILHHGIAKAEWFLFAFYAIATGLGITVGYHRLFAHVTYKSHPLIQFLLLFFGAAAFEQSGLKWASQHRNHHLYTDTDRDPYGINKGFWYAHIGWMIFWKYPNHYDNVNDLKKNKLIMHQHKYYGLWALVSGIVVPTLIGAAWGHALGVFLIAVCFRTVFVQHGTFCINSFCHWVGKRTYDPKSSARDHWTIALFTFGEGYHSFHHRFPSDYRNGIRWYHWDPSKWLITLLSFLRLVWDLKKVPQFRILHARMNAENYQVHRRLIEKMQSHPRFGRMKDAIESKYAKLQNTFKELEYALTEYRNLLQKNMSYSPADFEKIKSAAFESWHRKQSEFKAAYQRWNAFIYKISWILKASYT